MPIWIFSLVLYFKMLDEAEKFEKSLEYWKQNIVKNIIEKTLEMGETVIHGSSSKYFFWKLLQKFMRSSLANMRESLKLCKFH